VNLIPYDINKMFTMTAHRFNGPCLVADNNPFDFALERSRELFKKCPPASAILQDYYDDIGKYETTKTKFEKIKNKDDREKKLASLENSKPKIKFPKYLRINTI